MDQILMITLITFGALGGIFSGFKLKQARGTSHLNERRARLSGGGTFTEAIIGFFSTIGWGVATILCWLAFGYGCLKWLGNSSSQNPVLDISQKQEKANSGNVSESHDKKEHEDHQISKDGKTVLVEETKANEAGNNPSVANGTDNNFSDEEIERLEKEKKYSGDDPIVRSRLGLPPKKKYSEQ